MTPEDRLRQPAVMRGRSQARGSVPAPVPPSPEPHTGPDCAVCARYRADERAARKAYDRSRLTDITILFRRHLNGPRQSRGAAA